MRYRLIGSGGPKPVAIRIFAVVTLEAPVAIAIANNGALIELYAKRDKSSWTLVMTRPGGLSCVLVAGEEWNELPTREEERIAQLDSLAHRREMD